MLGFKFEGLKPKHDGNRINGKVWNAKAYQIGSKTSESSNKCFLMSPCGSQGGLFIGQLAGWFTLSKKTLTIP
jgi:hypothetical protein